jgi:hypothetical protein
MARYLVNADCYVKYRERGPTLVKAGTSITLSDDVEHSVEWTPLDEAAQAAINAKRKGALK